MTSSTLPGRRPDGHRARFVGSLSTHGAAGLGSHLHSLDERILAAVDQGTALARRYAPVMLRLSLALIFCWFGTLKVIGRSPVYDLLSATLPWFNPNVVVPMIGVVELTLGIGLLIPRARTLVVLILIGHLCGTFLTFIMAPGMMFRGSDPLALTANGEFVLKNLVLISAVLVLLGTCGRTERTARTARAEQTALAVPPSPE